MARGSYNLPIHAPRSFSDFSREELIGQPIEILIPIRARKAHQGHMDSYMKAPTRRSMGSGFALSGRRKDGLEFPVEVP